MDKAKIVQMAVRMRRPIPSHIANPPKVREGLMMFYGAFTQLNSCRSSGMSEGPIPWTAIYLWANEKELVGRQRKLLFHHVRAMDVAYLIHMKKKT